jgi:hypothetical protein
MSNRRLEEMHGVPPERMNPHEKSLYWDRERLLRWHPSGPSRPTGPSGVPWTNQQIMRVVWAILLPLAVFGLLVGVPVLVYVFYLLVQRDPGSLPGPALFFVGLALIAMLLLVALIVVMTRSRRAQAQHLSPAQLGPPQVSPDGLYVWDGQRQKWLPIHTGPIPPPRL